MVASHEELIDQVVGKPRPYVRKIDECIEAGATTDEPGIAKQNVNELATVEKNQNNTKGLLSVIRQICN